MENLTKRQAEVMEFIREHTDEKGYPPSVGEIMRRFSFASPHAVTCHIEALRRKGFLRKVARISRGIVLRDRPLLARVPVLGRVPAGTPVAADELPGESLALDANLVGGGETFALQVRGESMQGAGIVEGDYVIVRKGAEVRDGDIVVAFLDGEYTVKRFFRRKDGVELRPENPAFSPIRTKRVAVTGKVVGLYRKWA